MIDKRLIKDFNDDQDKRLLSISDTEIVIEFSKTLFDLYPHLVKLMSHCYDPYDEVVMNLSIILSIQPSQVNMGLVLITKKLTPTDLPYIDIIQSITFRLSQNHFQ
ncbi:MAG: hypothetical protein IPH88_03850 [Bacteroidales bacterium]|nr:hypothetical protein [Bacteroidales bacterium]